MVSKMRRTRQGNLVELPLLIALVGLSLAVFIAVQAYLRKADYGLLAIPFALLGVAGFWAVWTGFCYVITKVIHTFSPASEVDVGLVFIVTTLLAMLPLSMLSLGILLWGLIIRPIVRLFS